MSAEKFDPFVSEWVSFSKNSKHNLIEKSLKLAQILEYPDLNIPKYIEKINEIGNSLKLKIKYVKNSTYLISMLNEHVFEKYGFQGDDEDYYDPRNNFLNAVIDKKTGIPITLSIIYSEVAKYIGLDLKIVGFPGHVVVKYEEEMIIDPFYSGRLLTINDLEEILYRNFGDDVEFLTSSIFNFNELPISFIFSTYFDIFRSGYSKICASLRDFSIKLYFEFFEKEIHSETNGSNFSADNELNVILFYLDIFVDFLILLC